MKITSRNEITTAEKVALFRAYFSGLTMVYGTYDLTSGCARQVKAQVTDKVLLDHLKGRQPYGVYLLVKDRTRAIVADFDTNDPLAPMEFVASAKHYGTPAYVERSKSKGYHVWIFFEERGVSAIKARLVAHNILDDLGKPDTEIFPKQDALHTKAPYGNFINAPLFGSLVAVGKTVFVEPNTLNPYPDQWALLESIQRVDEHVLNEIIEINDLSMPDARRPSSTGEHANGGLSCFSLPPCAQKMFQDGVSEFQRVSCFRLAVHLKRVGLPFDLAVSALKTWALKNRPIHGKKVIQEAEILSQASYAYDNSYMGYGCDSPAIAPFCDPSCPVSQWRKHNEALHLEEHKKGDSFHGRISDNSSTERANKDGTRHDTKSCVEK